MFEFYERFVSWDESRSTDTQKYACCPLPNHCDDTPSFTVNIDSGSWFCHGCNIGGHYAEFVEQYYDVSRSVAVDIVTVFEKKKRWIMPTEQEVSDAMLRLQKRASFIDELKSFGIIDEIIVKLQLGCEDFRICFPIRSKVGEIVNIRKYLLPSKREDKDFKVIGVAKLNEPRFYPYDMLLGHSAGGGRLVQKDNEPLYIVEGEKDVAVALSLGLNAITSTGGAGLPKSEWHLFKDRDVRIMTDSDTAGDRLAAEYYRRLKDVAASILRVRLPVKDLSDYWQSTGGVLNFEEFIEEFKLSKKEQVRENIDKAMALSKSEDVSNIGTWIRLDNMSIVGTDPKTFTIPKKLSLRCGHHHGICTNPCAAATSREPEVVEVDPRQMVMFVNSSDRVQDAYLRKAFGCKDIVAEPHEMVNVQKILFQECASFVEGLEDASFEHRFGIFCYDSERLKPTSKYDMEAMRVTDPRSQQNYFVVRKAYTSATQLEGAAISDEAIMFLQSMAADKVGVMDLIDAHYQKWVGALGIEGRPDLFGLIMLTMLSVTELKWKSGTIKGWIDGMVIGDTRTGKSQMAQRFVKMLGMGAYINGENSRRTGVIGGVQRFDESWVITWGAIPLNDRGMLVIDEASGLDIEDIKELSATRSSGAVSINKIAKGEARARTRLLWLSNPRSGRNLDEFYWKGFGAFQEFIPVAEDQARYDVVISAAREDVDVAKFDDVERPCDIPINRYREAAAYAWSVVVDNVEADKEAVRAVKDAAIHLENEYGGGPLIVGVAVHEKVLRLAAALAVFSGSIEGTPRIVKIRKQHVDWAVEFLIITLSKATFDYSTYINEQKKSYVEKAKNMDFIKGQLAMNPALKVLLSANVFRGMQMREILGLSADESSKMLSEFLSRGLIRMTNQGAYAPDKMMIDIVKQMGGEYNV